MTVVTTVDGPVLTVTLNRPDRLNALDEPARHELTVALAGAAADETVRAVVLTGAGRAFCAGQDLAATHELVDTHDTVARTYNPLVTAVRTLPKPVVAAVNGAAVGAGMGLALACDLVLLAESATLSCAFGRMALVPDSGTAWFLTRRLGHQRAFALATSGRPVGAAEAVGLGLANEIVADGELAATAAKRAAELAGGPAKAFTLTKELLVCAADTGFEHMLAQEALAQGVAAAHPDHVARRTAFLAR